MFIRIVHLLLEPIEQWLIVDPGQGRGGLAATRRRPPGENRRQKPQTQENPPHAHSRCASGGPEAWAG
jgi:hypothetical protein